LELGLKFSFQLENRKSQQAKLREQKGYDDRRGDVRLCCGDSWNQPGVIYQILKFMKLN